MGLGFMLIIAKIIIFFQSLSMSNILAQAFLNLRPCCQIAHP